MDTINDRIQLIVDKHYNGNVTMFAKHIGAKQPTINDILGGKKNKPSFDTLYKILTAKPVSFSCEWLMLGIGEMTNRSPKESERSPLSLEDPLENYKCPKCDLLEQLITEKNALINSLNKLVYIYDNNPDINRPHQKRKNKTG